MLLRRIFWVAVGVFLIFAVVPLIIWMRAGQLRVHANGTRTLIQGYAENVLFYHQANNRFPKSLADVSGTDTPPLDLFGKPFIYEVMTNASETFYIESAGLSAASNRYVFKFQGTNLTLLRIE